MKLLPQSRPCGHNQTFGGYPDASSGPKARLSIPLWKQASRDIIERSKIKTRAPGNGPHFDESLGRYSAWPAGTSEWYRSINNNVNGPPASKAARRSMKDYVHDRPEGREANLESMRNKLGNMNRAVSRSSRTNKAPLWKTSSP